MSFLSRAEGPLDYLQCRYPGSKLLFRGPRRRLDAPYVAMLGSSETYGRFVRDPFPALVERGLGKPVVNLGYVNAGIDVFLNDRAVADLCAGSAATVVQLTGAQNLTSRLYAVHPRRNDRFVRAAPLLEALYREVDFTEFNFTRHLMVALQERSAEKFGLVVAELQAAWSARMRQLLRLAGGRRVLLWIGEEAPHDGTTINARAPDPLFVTRAMIDDLLPLVDAVVEVIVEPGAAPAGTLGMVFAPEDREAAESALTLPMHAAVADRVEAALARVLG